MKRHRILVAFDGSEESFWALEQAADAAQSGNGELGVVTVLPHVSEARDVVAVVPQLMDAPGQARRYLRHRGLDADLLVPVGDPAAEITRVARQGGYTTIYLGTREGHLAGELGRSVSREVALRSPATVVIAR